MIHTKYIVEYFGSMAILIAKIATEGHPVVIGLVSFALFWFAKDITTGYFTPFGPLAAYMIGTGTIEDVTYNSLAQYAGAITGILFLKPIKTFIKSV
jgi:hypothetical protein